jgi:lysozyme family protein
MAIFDRAVVGVLAHEGGYSNDPADPGGSTMRGITQSYLDGLVKQGKHDPIDVKDMTLDQTKNVYQTYWWNAYGYGAIADQLLANKVLDISVNVGPSRMHKFIQQACCDLGHSVLVDGQLGPKTYAAINAIDPVLLLTQLKTVLINYYTNLSIARPPMKKFLKGWLKRANS